MSLKIALPENTDLKPKITVFGVGGAGCNAVNNMTQAKLEGVEFWVLNTDAQALDHALTENRIQLGSKSTRGLGAGSHPEVGKTAAEETLADLNQILENTNMLFITAGMGGGTGTGAAPVIAKAAKERGILTVGVVTKPFHFEGARRMKVAELGLEELNKFVDTLIVIPNQNLFRLANEKTTFAEAFKMADNVLHSGVRGITDLITMPGLVNLDFADIRTVMSEMGKAMMGTGEAEGENRAVLAAEAAISNPLLDNSSMKGARGVLINITGGADMTLFQVDEAANRIREEVDPNANIIFGSAFNPDLENKMRVSVVATGIDVKTQTSEKISQAFSAAAPQEKPQHQPQPQQQNYMFNYEVKQEEQDEDDSDSFMPPRPAEPSSYMSSPVANTKPVANANQSEEDSFNDNYQPQITPQKREAVGGESDVVTKQGNDFFDIPAFIRKKIKL